MPRGRRHPGNRGGRDGAEIRVFYDSPSVTAMISLSRILPLGLAMLPVSRVATAQEVARSAASVPPYIEAIGQGEAQVAPDRATITLVVQTKGSTAATVAAQNARLQERVLDTLRVLGYTGDRVSTRNYHVGPNYEATARETRQVGYVARNAMTVRVTKLTDIGALIDAALARGATQVEGVAFESSRTDSARHAALASAAAKARADAEAIARAMGGSLGPLLDATTSGDPSTMARLRRLEISGVRVGGGGGGLTPITPAALEVHATVLARWQFRPTP
jgi:uncharacterized protein